MIEDRRKLQFGPRELPVLSRRLLGVGSFVALAACFSGSGRGTAKSDPSAQPTSPPKAASSTTPPTIAVARRIQLSDETRPPELPRATGVLLGERWGCVVFRTAAGSSVQCWKAPRGALGPPRAFKVPWLANKDLRAGPDRVCEFEKPALKLRCWHPPEPNTSAGRGFDAAFEWHNPNGASWNEAYDRADWVQNVFVGGTFNCLQAARDSSVWCLGADSFGQRGGSQSIPPPDAERTHAAFVQGLWPAQALTVGTWHACALAAPGGLARGGHISCWGRGDHGQLGTRALDTCKVGGVAVACAKTPVPGIRARDPVLALYAGDLYTCSSTPAGTSCWGASRDGFFGKSAACAPDLVKAWPTLHGSVAAPRAACSATPVPLPAIREFQQWMSVGPRGLCFDEQTPLTCLGAIPTPQTRNVTNVVVSPGDDASACGIRDHRAVCWGEGYSPREAQDLPVAIELEPMAPLREVAVHGATDPAPFAASCRIKMGCDFGPSPLPPCDPALPAQAWTLVRPQAKALVGKVVSVKGPLGVGPQFQTLMGCHGAELRECCNSVRGPVVLGDAPLLPLTDFFCAGDESQTCCNAPAYGQSVVATGLLAREEPSGVPGDSGYRLNDVTLCSPTAR